MLTVSEATAIVLANVTSLTPARAALVPETLGLLLAEDITSDLDMPPFDKAMMDGFALRCADLSEGNAEFAIIEEIPAGKTPTRVVGQGQAARIMTGAPIPQGADAVVMIERCALLSEARVRVNDTSLQPGRNILTRGKEMRVGETVLWAGTRLRPQEFGLLASVGRPEVLVVPRPSVAILSTGDEIVEPSVKPGPSQIRNSNGMMLLAQTVRAGATPRFLGIAPDEPMKLKSMIAAGLESDVLLLSGGVSAGKLDLVPGILQELGVEALFHKVTMKPGKPILFGIQGAKLVFGLPGNPVSSMVCFELFVRPALRTLMGQEPGPSWVQATLMQDRTYRTDRPTYHPAILKLSPTGWMVDMVAWFGSPDLRGVAPANAFALLPAGEREYSAGELLDVLRVEAVD
jgi:molybdopterin molybdotransferase